MKEGKLFIRLPGEKNFKVYLLKSEKAESTLHFHWVSFNNQNNYRWALEETRDEGLTIDLAAFTSLPAAKSKDDYLQLLQKAIAEIEMKQLGKIVVSRYRKEKYRLEEPVSFFKKLAKKYPEACAYLFYHPEIGCWMGATPETLLRAEKDRVETMSLAGTRALDEADSFTSKEETEQQLVTDYIKEIFEETKGLEAVQIEGPSRKTAGHLVHLYSKITARKTQNFPLLSLLNSLHPTPAVAGNPLQEALTFIQNNEGYSRSYYTGYFGMHSREEAHFFVNLRCMQLFSDALILYAGGGITAESDPESEWEETETKMRTLSSIFAF